MTEIGRKSITTMVVFRLLVMAAVIATHALSSATEVEIQSHMVGSLEEDELPDATEQVSDQSTGEERTSSDLRTPPIDDSSRSSALDNGILEWIHNSPGGFYTRKQELRYMIPDDPTSLLGIFARERIEAGELLVKVPWDRLIKSLDPDEQDQLTCGMVRVLAKEMVRGSESEFAPYIEYLQLQRDGQFPSLWSPEGQRLLIEVLGGERSDAESVSIPPTAATTWIVNDYRTECGGDLEDKIGVKAAMLALLRADDAIMIPAYDFYNHRNGDWHNAVTKIVPGKFHETHAKKIIEVGEQVYISYNRCPECEGRSSGYGTAEMFRDYGFVEVFPQRWHYYEHDKIEFELNRLPDGDGPLTLEWVHRPEGDQQVVIQQYLRRQLERLERLWEVKWKPLGNGDIPSHEWDLVWHFQQANIVAIRAALNAMEGKDVSYVTSEQDVMNYYDKVLDEEELLVNPVDYELTKCNLSMDYPYQMMDVALTPLQDLDFFRNPDTEDVCMDRDELTHVCSSFRPAYYEYMVHPAASYLEKVERVLIMGNGASLILHEIMQYPDIDSILVMDPDQMVTRKSHQHFHSDPHFDDPRVEWWFGDPGEIMLVSDNYRNTFDLVLVDLSRDAVNATFHNGLDFAQLVHSKGIVIINDYYMDQMKESFRYSSRLLYERPNQCAHTFVMGSHTVDFLHVEAHDHDVVTLLYEHSLMEQNRLLLLHEFQETTDGGTNQCHDRQAQESDEGLGVLEIVELSEITLAPEIVATQIEAVLKTHGFELVSTAILKDGSVFVATKEGYVLTHIKADHEYIGMDVQLSSSVHKLKSLHSSLMDALSGHSTASYRLVTNGVERRRADVPSKKAVFSPASQATLEGKINTTQANAVMLEESLKLLVESIEVKSLVICEDGAKCPSVALLKDQSAVNEVYEMPTCALGTTRSGDLGSTMLACEHRIMEWIKKTFLDEEESVNLIVVDGHVSRRSLQVLHGVINIETGRDEWIERQNLVISLPSASPQDAASRRVFIERLHQGGQLSDGGQTIQTKATSSVRAELSLVHETGSESFDIVSQGLLAARSEIGNLEIKLNERLGNFTVKIQSLRGGRLDDSQRLIPRHFSHRDYMAGEDEFLELPTPLGVQTIFVLGVADTTQFVFDDLLSHLDSALEAIQVQNPTHHSREELLVHNTTMLEFEDGHLVTISYGGKFVDINLYVKYENGSDQEYVPLEFMETFLEVSDYDLLSADTMPRGPTATAFPRSKPIKLLNRRKQRTQNEQW